MRNFEDLFDLGVIKKLTFIMSILAAVVVVAVNIGQLIQTGEIESARLLYFRPHEPEPVLNHLYSISVILAFLSAALLVYMNLQLKNIEKRAVEKSKLREKLRATTTYLALGKVFEGFYLLLLSDFREAWEVIAQLYILFDSLAIILFIAIAFSIFLVNDLMKNENIARFSFIVCMAAYFLAFIIMVLYGLSPEAFSIGIFLVIGITILLALLGVVVVAKIAHIYGRITTNKRPLIFIAVQILLLIITIALLIGCGLTISFENLLPNRLLRFARMIVFVLVALLYYPAFIAPALKSEKTA